MNELESIKRKYRIIARIFDACVILAIIGITVWNISPAFRILIKLAILRSGLYLYF